MILRTVKIFDGVVHYVFAGSRTGCFRFLCNRGTATNTYDDEDQVVTCMVCVARVNEVPKVSDALP
jgi:hypothetical protein